MEDYGWKGSGFKRYGYMENNFGVVNRFRCQKVVFGPLKEIAPGAYSGFARRQHEQALQATIRAMVYYLKAAPHNNIGGTCRDPDL